MPYTDTKNYTKSPAPIDDKALYRYLEEELRKIKLTLDAVNKVLEELKARVTF